MENAEEAVSHNAQLIYVGRKDTTRLLEAYVRRSISLNDGATEQRRTTPRKWLTISGPDKRLHISGPDKRLRRYSSDTSVILEPSSCEDRASELWVSEPNASEPNSSEPKPSEPKPSEPKPSEPKPSEPKPLEPKPSEPNTSEPNASEPNSSEPNTSEPNSSEPKPSEPNPSEPKPSEPNASDPKPSGEVPVAQPKASVEEEKAEKKGKKRGRSKGRKPSFWRSVVGFFSRKESRHREEGGPSPERVTDHAPPQEADHAPPQEAPSPTGGSCLPLPGSGTPSSMRRTRSRKRFSRKRLSFRRPSKKDVSRPSVPADRPSVRKPADSNVPTSVDLPYSYYEKVSEELQRIVHEVQDTEVLTNEEVIDRIIVLMKQQGDAIDNKLKENPSISSFFERLSYSSFQQLADSYVRTESPRPPDHPSVPNTAPELVKLAFTLDFTARVAGLSRQATNHIMGLGNRYLEDRFTYATQATPDHLLSSDPE